MYIPIRESSNHESQNSQSCHKIKAMPKKSLSICIYAIVMV